MKNIISILFLLFIFVSSANAYVDMSLVKDRARDLNMVESDYALAMALSGILSGSMFGLFLCKCLFNSLCSF